MRVEELPDMLRKYDVEPVVVAGFETRGNEFPSRPRGALRHWTVGSLRMGIPSLHALTFGRGKPNPLAGPLCNVAQERADRSRDDRAYCIASGKANHAGDGLWNGIRGNYGLLGLEIEWIGPGESFTARRREVSERIMAALIDCTTGDHDDAAEHREYALPPGRKIDTNLDGDYMRDQIRVLRSGLLVPDPVYPVPVADEEDNVMDLPGELVKGDSQNPNGEGAHWFLTDRVTRQWVKNRAHAALLLQDGKAKAAKAPDAPTIENAGEVEPWVWPQAVLNSIRLVGEVPPLITK